MGEIRISSRSKVNGRRDADVHSNCSRNKTLDISKRSTTSKLSNDDSPRIPLCLQKIFLRSNGGHDMENVVPPACAEQVYHRDVRWNIKKRINKGGVQQQKQLQKQKLQQLLDEKNKRSNKNSKSLTKKITYLPRLLFSKKRAEKQEEIPAISPEIFLNDLMRSRGYSTQKQSTMESIDYAVSGRSYRDSGLCNKSQKLLDYAKAGNDEELMRLIEQDSWLCLFVYENSRGPYGETLVHMICRYCKNKETLSTFLEKTGIDNLQILDDCGRTPLHYLCWRGKKGEDHHPCIEMVDTLIKSKKKCNKRGSKKNNNVADIFLMTDANGWSPLSYVSKQQWKQWNEYLDSKKNFWWKKTMPTSSMSSTTSSMMSLISKESVTSDVTSNIDTGTGRFSRRDIDSETSSLDDSDDDEDSDSDRESCYSDYDDGDDDDLDDPYYDISNDPIMKEMMMNVLAKKKKAGSVS